MPNPPSLTDEASHSQATRRASQMLREILTKNPKAEHFSIRLILETIGDQSAETSLILLSIPGIVPVPEGSELAGIPTSIIASQMVAGRKEVKLPKAILDRSVPRRSLAVAIHVVLPILERAEKAVKPRWLWVSHPITRRLLGIVIFLLALTIAFPFIGVDMLHATSIFIISLGLNERDGLAILIGIAAAVASLVLVTGVRFSARGFASNCMAWLRRAARRFGLKSLAFILQKFGLRWSHLIEATWQDLLLVWNPEKPWPFKRDPEAAAAVKSRVTAKLRRRGAPPITSTRQFVTDSFVPVNLVNV